MSARAMKDSGVPWIGEIPAGWELAPLARLVDPRRPITYGIVLPGENVSDGVFIIKSGDCTKERLVPEGLHRTTREIESKYARSRMRRGDLVISIRGTVGLVAAIPEALDGANLTQDTARIAPKANVHTPWLLQTLWSAPLRTEIDLNTVGATVRGLNLRELRRLRVPTPPLEEQQRIAAFLDARTLAIDAAVAEHEATLTLLAERRRSLLSHAVTRGLDASAPMRDSGVSWIGPVPAHWVMTRLKRTCDVRTGIAKGRASEGSMIVRPYLRVANVQDGFLRLDDIATIEVTEDEAARYRLRRGDVLMNEGGDFDKLGRGYVWEEQIEGCLHQNHVFAVRPRRGVDPYWINLVTQSDPLKYFFTSRAKQSTNLASISSTNLGEAPIPLPPLDEQRAIVAHLRERTAALDAAADTARRAIELLREYRQSLVTAAVTGRIAPEAMGS